MLDEEGPRPSPRLPGLIPGVDPLLAGDEVLTHGSGRLVERSTMRVLPPDAVMQVHKQAGSLSSVKIDLSCAAGMSAARHQHGTSQLLHAASLGSLCAVSAVSMPGQDFTMCTFSPTTLCATDCSRPPQDQPLPACKCSPWDVQLRRAACTLPPGQQDPPAARCLRARKRARWASKTIWTPCGIPQGHEPTPQGIPQLCAIPQQCQKPASTLEVSSSTGNHCSCCEL